MKTNLMMAWMKHFFAGSFLLATMLLISCGDDPEPANEEELITTLLVTLTDDGGNVVTLKFYDADGDGPIVPIYTYNPNIAGPNSAAVLQPNKSYSASIVLLNETESPVEDVTEEIEEEADEHLFCFTTNVNSLAISYNDTEADYIAGGSSKPVGLASIWTTGTAGTGTVTIILRHQPGIKTGSCPGGGETDIEVTFNVTIQ